MNYLRGAVNAISAPYQYYKELPPINPSTLTGAIDVIVIERPTNDGGTEFVCSPFHVRFGKWQVLRPSEKKVNLFVNGNPIPFNMKIGEAGEAFFVFETVDDVPEDLITSPIIQPTVPDVQEDTEKKEPVNQDRFGAKEDLPTDVGKALRSEDELMRVEPDFLDLNGESRSEEHLEDAKTTPKQKPNVPNFVRKSASRATISQSSLPSPPPSREPSIERSRTPDMDEQDRRVDAALKALNGAAHVPEVEYHQDITLDMEGYKSGYHDRERSDRTIRSSSSSSKKNLDQAVKFPHKSSSYTSSPRAIRKQPSLLSHTQSAIHSADASSPSPPSSPSPSPPPLQPPSASFRATSEPPPDIEVDGNSGPSLTISVQEHQITVQEYSWEWGAFPQPSPMKASFGKGGRPEPPNPAWLTSSTSRKSLPGSKRKSRLTGMILPHPVSNSAELEGWKEDRPQGHGVPLAGRSRSVPPNFEDSLTGKGRRSSRVYKEYEDVEDEDENIQRGRPWTGATPEVEGSEQRDQLPEAWSFGAGGTLTASKEDSSMLVLSIEGKKVVFQLSLFEDQQEDRFAQGERGRACEQKAIGKLKRGEVETARLFDRYKVDLNRFLDDDTVVQDPRLVIRWAGDQYITRSDGSPLMDALVHWRASTQKKRQSGDALRPVSPPPSGGLDLSEHYTEDGPSKEHGRSKSEPPSSTEIRKVEEQDSQEAAAATKEDAGKTEGQTLSLAKKPTSSSWVQWWSRSRKNDAASKANLPLDPKKDSSSASLPLPSTQKPSSNVIPSTEFVRGSSEPSTPIQHPADVATVSGSRQDVTPTRPPSTASEQPQSQKKFAKTLRLTSDQLRSLNLKPGANSITFSLSANGVAAATARIFVWDSKDLVLISDIDGTITKSDGLGHVFAMIGRDWTHVGVAKLYTDIVRNGYKIMYLTSRAIGQADATRDYLKGIKQNNYQLPEGPVIMSPDRLMASLHREVIMRKPEVFKMACLRDIQRLFGETAKNPFYAGFGNRITDALSYRSVNVPSARIFTIDSSGEVKMELLELAGYKSSYIHMTDLVDQMFPPIHRKWTPEYTDFNYWKTPVQEFPLPDLSPPSPALSARSDTSNQSALARLRNFSLGGNSNRPSVSKQSSIATIPDNQEKADDPYRSSHLRQMSSFERLSSTLGFMSRVNNDDHRRSESPESSSSYVESDDEDDDVLDTDGKRKRRQRRRSMTSMPGTLDEMHFGMYDDEEGQAPLEDHHFIHHVDDEGEEGYDGDDGDEHGDPEQDPDETFDDDILAAGEMKNVPFL
ncbi:hypothetical protein NLJ89_g4023 [Agrocybe chaxingu]|uniref:phosphatidate phosphatase n=1 Tax=Agrocybe chaxingu TaxID=84603 RepID=A0A9W8K978_9AGAR|nr:hypothetical protein NLJ89_g4023 [Agrocybe chaxingu]